MYLLKKNMKGKILLIQFSRNICVYKDDKNYISDDFTSSVSYFKKNSTTNTKKN